MTNREERLRIRDRIANYQGDGQRSADEVFHDFTRLEYGGLLVPIDWDAKTNSAITAFMQQKLREQIAAPENFHLVEQFIRSNRYQELRRASSEKSASAWNTIDRLKSEEEALSDRPSEDQVDRSKSLKSAENIDPPDNIREFLKTIEQCMRDDDVDSLDSENHVRVFTAKAAKHLVEQIGEDTERRQRAWQMFVAMSKSNGYRRILKRSIDLEVKLNSLRNNYPNFSQVVDHIIGQIRVWSLKRKSERRLKPILLNGPKGVGKTAFARALAEALDTNYTYFNTAASSMGAILTGSSQKWSNGQPGLIFNSMASGETASPLVLLDEIEKATSSHQFPIEGALLALLEPQTSREFRDEFGNLEFDASRVIYVATSNDSDLISAPLLSRFDAFDIEYPDRQQRETIICNMVDKSYQNIRLSQAALTLLSSHDADLRSLQTMLDKVIRQHIDHTLNQMELEGSQSQITSESMQTIVIKEVSLQGEQTIEESTVQICMQEVQEIPVNHFGFIGV